MKNVIDNQHELEGVSRQKISSMGERLTVQPQGNIRMIQEHNSKEMGYELASALIEREIKNKM